MKANHMKQLFRSSYGRLLYLRRCVHRNMSLRPHSLATLGVAGFIAFLLILILSDHHQRVDLQEQLLHSERRYQQLKKEFDALSTTPRINAKPRKHVAGVPVVVAITPTYTRHTQKADLTRLSLTLRHVPNFHWILVEDSEQKTPKVSRFLASCGLHYSHLNVRTPREMQLGTGEARWRKHRGVEQRNLGLSYILEHGADFLPDVNNVIVYFMDDDNTYSLELFEEMRSIKVVGVWPVALTGGLLWEGPVCNANGVRGFHTSWRTDRFFPMDMAGFAFNIKALHEHRSARLDPTVHYGFLESSFLTQLLDNKREHMEPKGDLCRKILVWHTRTADPKMKQEQLLIAKGQQSDPAVEV